jgi:hypothetical protein
MVAQSGGLGRAQPSTGMLRLVGLGRPTYGDVISPLLPTTPGVQCP